MDNSSKYDKSKIIEHSTTNHTDMIDDKLSNNSPLTGISDLVPTLIAPTATIQRPPAMESLNILQQRILQISTQHPNLQSELLLMLSKLDLQIRGKITGLCDEDDLIETLIQVNIINSNDLNNKNQVLNKYTISDIFQLLSFMNY